MSVKPKVNEVNEKKASGDENVDDEDDKAISNLFNKVFWPLCRLAS